MVTIMGVQTKPLIVEVIKSTLILINRNSENISQLEVLLSLILNYMG